MVGAALAYSLSRCALLYSHLRHPNQKQVLNNKDRNKDDYNDKGEVGGIHNVGFELSSRDYMPNLT